MVNKQLTSGADGYRNVKQSLKMRDYYASHRFFARIARLTTKLSQATGRLEVVLAAAIHSLLLTIGSFCRGR
ncbi:hypothetical protein [Tardiphaga sp.]|jgi:hypothetical protein|uniref:hypothetical protein n=1 Tax=Tardiphaga sp. TaxID=1926292 RepID=UPI0037DA7028